MIKDPNYCHTSSDETFEEAKPHFVQSNFQQQQKKTHIYHDQLLKGGKYVKKSKTKGNLSKPKTYQNNHRIY